MYQMLAGTLPFKGSNKFSMIYQITQYDPPPPSSHRREVPASLDRIVRRAMQKEAGQRYQSGDEFAEELIEALRSGLGDQRETFGDADKFAALRAMRFFKAFADPELWEVVALGKWERVPLGTALLQEGQPGDFFCVLVDGEMRGTKNKKPERARRRMLRRNGLSLARHQQRGATVTASRNSRSCASACQPGEATIACRSKFDRAFIGILVERLNLAIPG